MNKVDTDEPGSDDLLSTHKKDCSINGQPAISLWAQRDDRDH
ncbi:hypothetical protein [Paenibacillus agricola]|nr:hypothetical protein [Paenibacillus agricola]